MNEHWTLTRMGALCFFPLSFSLLSLSLRPSIFNMFRKNESVFSFSFLIKKCFLHLCPARHSDANVLTWMLCHFLLLIFRVSFFLSSPYTKCVVMLLTRQRWKWYNAVIWYAHTVRFTHISHHGFFFFLFYFVRALFCHFLPFL